jgi:hypothetical protein
MGILIESLPEQEEIPMVLEGLFERLAKIKTQEGFIVAQIDLMRAICDHAEKELVSHTGHLFTRCRACGKEW